jgi:hypothetical protein
MMDPEQPGDWIDRYNNNELNESELVVFLEWMKASPILRSEVSLDASLTRFLQDAEVIDLMNKVKAVSQQKSNGSPLMNFLLVAASLLCLALIGGLFYHLDTKKRSAESSAGPFVRQPNHIKPEKDGDKETYNIGQKYHQESWRKTGYVKPVLMADNYKPMPELELLSGSVTRSGQFVLVSPKVDLAVPAGTTVLFSWRYSDKEAAVLFVIMDNAGNQLSRQRMNNSGSFILKTKGLGEGLYYWKILANEDLVIMGKLTIHSGVIF